MYTPASPTGGTRTAPKLGRLAAVLVGLLALLGWAASPAGAAAPVTTPPPEVSITMTTPLATAGLGGAVPQVLATAAGLSEHDQIALTLTTTATFNQDVTFRLDDGGAPGDVSPPTVTLLRGTLSVAQTVTYSEVASGITLTPVYGGKGKSPAFTVGQAQQFDIVRVLQFANKGQTSIGADTCTTDSPDTNCGIALLPNSFTSDAAALTVGAPAQCGGKTCGASLVQFTAGMAAGLYTQANPATMIFRCDKSVCGNAGVNKFKVHFSYAAAGDLSLVAPACLVKGQSNDPTDAFGGACVDYVNSTRDNAGDTLLYFYFLHDLRGSGY